MRKQSHTLRRGLLAITWLPEFNVALFALLLNYPWELIQAPLFEGMATAPHWEAVQGCTRAAFGDAVIALAAYWAVAVAYASRNWIARPTTRQVLAYMTVGLLITVAIEWLALRGLWLTAWAYSPAMPVMPGLGIGLVPVLQWLVLPLTVVVMVGRQLRSRPVSGVTPAPTAEPRRSDS